MGFFGLFDDENPSAQKSIGLLIGNVGQQMWARFSKSTQIADGKPNSMNRWTKSALDEIAKEVDAKAIYPFGDTIWPFQKFAKQAMGLHSSPLGLMIHPNFGLWHAYRGALVFSSTHDKFLNLESALKHQKPAGEHPCQECISKPCLNTCPVGAFNGESLDVPRCFEHLDSGKAPECISVGCVARNACPIGREFKYSSDQLAFSYEKLIEE